MSTDTIIETRTAPDGIHVSATVSRFGQRIEHLHQRSDGTWWTHGTGGALTEGSTAEECAARLITARRLHLATDAHVDAIGTAPRWNSNGTIVPADWLAVYATTAEQYAEMCVERDAETDAFLARYRAANAGGPSAEERAEARAAHGPGVKLVNVITGTEWTT